MPIKAWLRPPRHLVVLFLGITLVLMAALVWFGARLLQQDRALERQRVQDRLERAADQVAAVLTRRLAEAEDSLVQLSATPRTELTAAAGGYAEHLVDDALVVVLSVDGLESFPAGRLLYYPVPSTSVEPPASLFAAGEAAEFRARNFARAGRLFQSLARSDDPAIRAVGIASTGADSPQSESSRCSARGLCRSRGLGKYAGE